MNGRTALAAGGTVLLLLAGSLLPQALFAAQDQVDQAGVRSVRDQQLSLDLSEEESGYWARWKLMGSGSYFSSNIASAYMTRTDEEIADIAGELVAQYQELAGELGGSFAESGDLSYDISCSLIWDSATSSSFRVWDVFCYANDTGGYLSVVLDDETALPLNFFCSHVCSEAVYQEQSLLNLTDLLLEPVVSMLTEKGVTGAVMNRYPAYTEDATVSPYEQGIVFDLERADENAVETLVCIDESDCGVGINVYIGEEDQEAGGEMAVEETEATSEAVTDAAK